ncbi:hypothetical protein [Myceligenerans pegani]|uniref:Uncharacterized protein n=1 Tax=Myceligenerans pegani TaxID=2776917 RepID=A0ABR9MT48_9MICO|nr:hypothetical protein [Myceligenerans sp. TRM 65318]MBE1874206.1 hypothetical protein [Myceligenerans sp. TRM 65318]MBE3016478.1 hypothetical protein [Myceligenerans sp. TRM 65318]
MSDKDDDDARYVDATVRRIARLAETSPNEAEILIVALRDAGYEARDVEGAIDTAVRSAVDRVAGECDTARSVSASQEGIAAAAKLLAATEAPLRVLFALGGRDNTVTRDVCDEVARVVDRSVATYAKWHDTDLRGGPLLIRARDLATSPSTRSAIDKHLRRSRRRSSAVARANQRRARPRPHAPRLRTVRTDRWSDRASGGYGQTGDVGRVAVVLYWLFWVVAWGVPIGLVILLVRWLEG